MILFNIIIYWLLTRAIIHTLKTKKGAHDRLTKKPGKNSIDNRAEMELDFDNNNKNDETRINFHLEIETKDIPNETLQDIEEIFVENQRKQPEEEFNDIFVSENGMVLDNDQRFRYYFNSNPFLDKSNVSKPVYDNTKKENISSTIEEIRKNVSEIINGNNEQIGMVDNKDD